MTNLFRIVVYHHFQTVVPIAYTGLHTSLNITASEETIYGMFRNEKRHLKSEFFFSQTFLNSVTYPHLDFLVIMFDFVCFGWPKMFVR